MTYSQGPRAVLSSCAWLGLLYLYYFSEDFPWDDVSAIGATEQLFDRNI